MSETNLRISKMKEILNKFKEETDLYTFMQNLVSAKNTLKNDWTCTGGFGIRKEVENLFPEMSIDQKRIVYWITDSEYKTLLSKKLNGKPCPEIEEINNIVKSQTPIERDMVLYKGVKLNHFRIDPLTSNLKNGVLSGNKLTMPISTTTSVDAAQKFAYFYDRRKGGVVLEITVPEGSHVLDIDEFLGNRVKEAMYNEQEMLLQAGTTLVTTGYPKIYKNTKLPVLPVYARPPLSQSKRSIRPQANNHISKRTRSSEPIARKSPSQIPW